MMTDRDILRGEGRVMKGGGCETAHGWWCWCWKEVSRRPELKTKGSEGVCDRGGEVIFCSVVSFQRGLAGRSCWVTGRVGDNR